MSTDGAAKALSELPLTLPVDRGGPHRCSGRAPPGLREGTVVHRVESEVVVEAGHEIDCFRSRQGGSRNRFRGICCARDEGTGNLGISIGFRYDPLRPETAVRV